MKTPPVSLRLGVSVLLLSALTVSADHPLILQIRPLPVKTGSEVTLYCQKSNGDFVKAYFYGNKTSLGSEMQVVLTIPNIQKSHEGLYYCATNDFGKSPEIWLRVKDPPPTSDPQPKTLNIHNSAAFNNNDATVSSASTPPVTVIAVFLHLLVFCPFCICTVLTVLICCSRKTGNKQVVSMEMTQCDEEYDDITTEHDLRADQY